MKGLFLLFLLVSCAPIPERSPSMTERQPRVVGVDPVEGRGLDTHSRIQLSFSHRLDPTSVDSGSIFIVKGRIEDPLALHYRELKRVVEKGELTTVPSSLRLADPPNLIFLSIEGVLSPGTDYTLVVTPGLLSEARIPFSQDPPRGAIPFLHLYQTEPADILPPTFEEEPPVFGKVVLNEIFYDAVGSDTDGVLFVELYGTTGLDLSGLQVIFVNGDTGARTDSVTLPKGARIGPDGFYLIADARDGKPAETQVGGADLIDNFDPQNGPDSVQLLNASGELVDVLGYGEGLVERSEDGFSTYEGTPAADVVGGHSLERATHGQDTDNNSVDFIDRTASTPRG